MRKADVVLAVLVVLAVVATAVGGLSGDRWTDERTLHFASHQETLAAQGPSPAGGAGARFNWTAADNATSANLTVSLAFTGQALRGGTATVSIRVTSPDGHAQPPIVHSWAIEQGATSGTTTLNVSASWANQPDTLRDTTDDGHAFVWSQPLVVAIVVERPADLPLAQFAFTASVSGTLTTFAAA